MSWRSVSICDHCWNLEEPGRIPVRLRDPIPDPCYACGRLTDSGIVVRREVG